MTKIAATFFYDLSSRITEMKTNTEKKWDLLKLKKFLHSKETINKMKRQSTDWEKNICK